ncbi:MAG: leucine-rich repeat protein [Clostridia bacterium]|nr:leucine-rich repeat protein [Clostridia bacterium]
MKILRATVSLLLTLLLLASVCSAAFAAFDADAAPLPDGFDPSADTFEPLPEEVPEDPFEYRYSVVDGDILVTPIPPGPQENVAIPENATADADWDALFEAMFQALYTGQRVDVLDLRIPYTSENRTYISSNEWYNPRFMRTYANYSFETVDGVSYISYFTVNEEDSAEYRMKYDACMDAIDTLMYGIKDDTELSTADKCLILHDRLCAWCEYDKINKIAKDAGTGVIPEESYSPYGPLVLRIGVCNGIALAYNWMLDILGVENYYISSSGLNHGWTMLYLDGEPYFVDPTWDDPTWDVPGRVVHTYFLLSYPTFHPSHDADDYTTAPSSDAYENYFSKNSKTKILYINGAMYYHQYNTDNIIKRLPDGTETVAATVNRSYSYPYNEAGNITTRRLPTIQMLAIGDWIIYTEPRSVHAFNTVTGEDTLVYTPTDALFPTWDYYLMGLEQIDGVIYCYSNNMNGYDRDSTPEEYLDLTTNMRESFTFCAHDDYETLEQLRGDNCLTLGQARKICPDCGKIIYVDGEGIYGDHSFTVETASEETYAVPATCTTPARYYYTCAFCDGIEREPDHTFSYGEVLPHRYESTDTPATPTCPGYVTNVCPDCGDVSYTGFTFCPGSTANGVIDDAFAWQIVDGTLSIYGHGDLPDYSADTLPPWNAYKDDITALVINDGVTAVGAYNFYDLDKMAAMTLTDGITVIGQYAFANAKSLTEFVMPASLLTIRSFAFDHAEKIETITNNDVIKTLEGDAFSYLSALQDIVIPGTVTSIGHIAFRYCNSVKTVELQEGSISSMPSFMWMPGANIEEIRLPSNITNIPGSAAYNSLSACKKITVADNNPAYTSADGVLYTKDMTTLVKYPGQRPGAYYTVPDTVTTIAYRAFTWLRNLRYLDMTDLHIRTLSNAPFFSNYRNLRIDLPAELTAFSGTVFYHMDIDKIYVPASVTAVSDTFNDPQNLNAITFFTNSDSAGIKTVCDEKNYPCTVLAGHTHTFSETVYSETGTCMQPGIAVLACECGQFEITEIPAGHSFTAETANDDTLRSEASCSSPAVYYYSCETCGTVERNDDHTFTFGSALEHSWEWTEDVPATCGTPGTQHEECSACHMKRNENTPIFPTGDHDYTARTVKDDALKSEASCTAPAAYYYSCANCGAVEGNDSHVFTNGDTVEHSWQWIIDTEPGCATSGIRHEECSVCHEKRNENSPVSPTGDHDYSAATVKDDARKSEADCSSPAVYYYSCKDCGAVEHNDAHTFTSGSALEHNWEWTEDVAATCGTAGTQHEECSACHEKRNENTPISPTGDHDYTARTVKDDALKSEAACAAPAAYYYSCANCGAVEGNDDHTFTAGTAAGHKFVWITDVGPTCTEGGVRHEECSVCHEKRNENSPVGPTGIHDYTAATVKDDALKSAATCTAPAVYYYSCKDCGTVERNDAHTFTSGSALGHSFGEWITDTPASCEEEGVKRRVCGRCDLTEYEPIAKTGHVDADGNGICDNCDKAIPAGNTPSDSGSCPYCHGTHTGPFGGLIAFFHRILYFFRTLFNK